MTHDGVRTLVPETVREAPFALCDTVRCDTGCGGSGRRVPSEAQEVDPSPQERQEGGEGHDGRRGGDQGDAHPGEGEGAQEVQGEDEQRREADRDCQRGHRDRPPRGLHRAQHRDAHRPVLVGSPVRPGARGELLAEPADDEERVIDGQTQAEGGDEVDREDRHVGEQGDHPQREEGAQHRDRTDQQGQAGRDQATEDDDEQQHDERDGERLGGGQVRLDPIRDRREDRALPGVAELERSEPVAELLTETGRLGEHGVLVASESGGDDGAGPVVAAQDRDPTEVPVAEHLGHRGVVPEPAGELLARSHDGRVVDGRTLAALVDLRFADRGDDHEVGRSRAEPVPQQELGPGGLGGRIAEPACRQASEDPGSDRPGQGEEDGGGGEDGAGSAQCQESDRSEHGDLRRVGLRCR